MILTRAKALMVALMVGCAWVLPLVAEAADADIEKANALAQQVVDKAVAFLKTRQQPNGSWQSNDREPPAMAALALRVLVQDPRHGPNCPEAKKAIAWLLSLQKEDGSIHNGMLANYNTAIIVSGLAAVDDPALKGSIDKAVAYLKASQWTEGNAGPDGKGIDANSPFYGGWGYGGTRGRPDLSNTAVVLDALKDAGLKQDDPAIQKALRFVSRLQNNSESNPAAWAGNDGGFIYNPGRSGEGESSAGEYATPEGKRLLRSYGSMTYAGLKSMIHAGLTKSDPRVKAAWSWVRSNWTLTENPGMAAAGPDMAKSGIYYYYNMLARALTVWGDPSLVDPQNVAHNWRIELIETVASQQKADGSFVGDPRWMEDNPVIATTLATLAVQDAARSLRGQAGK